MITKFKFKTFLLAFLSIILFCNCKGQFKSDNGDFLVIKDINFDGKDEFIEYIEKERNIFFEGGPGLFSVQYTETSTPYVFPILKIWYDRH